MNIEVAKHDNLDMLDGLIQLSLSFERNNEKVHYWTLVIAQAIDNAHEFVRRVEGTK